jgi:hypothetical protein
MMFEELKAQVDAGNLPESPSVIKFNQSYVRDRGNYNVITDMAVELASILGKDGVAIKSEMLAGTYENMLTVFSREFSQVVVIEPLTEQELAEFS